MILSVSPCHVHVQKFWKIISVPKRHTIRPDNRVGVHVRPTTTRYNPEPVASAKSGDKGQRRPGPHLTSPLTGTSTTTHQSTSPLPLAITFTTTPALSPRAYATAPASAILGRHDWILVSTLRVFEAFARGRWWWQKQQQKQQARKRSAANDLTGPHRVRREQTTRHDTTLDGRT